MLGSQNQEIDMIQLQEQITQTKDVERKGVLLEQYISMAEQQQGREQIVDALLDNGRHYFQQRKYEKATAFYERVIAMNLCTMETAHAYNNLGLIERMQGKYHNAQGYFTDAITYYEQFGNSRSIAHTLINAAQVSRLMGDFEKEINELYEALPIVDTLNDPALKATLYYSLSIALRNMESYEEAVDYQKQALAIRKDLNDRKGVAASYSTLGNIYREWEDYAAAIPYFRKAIGIKDSLNLRQSLGVSYHGLGSTYTGVQKWDSAWYYYRKAFEIKKAVSDQRGLAETSKELARVALVQKQMDSAEYYLKYTDDWLNNSEDLVMRLRTTNIKKDYFVQLGQTDSALHYGEKYVEYYKEFLINKQGSVVKELELKYEENKDLINVLKQEQEQFKQVAALKDIKIKYRNLGLLLAFFVIVSLVVLFFWYRSRASLLQIQAHQQGQEVFRKQVAMVLHDEVANKISGLRLKIVVLENGTAIGEKRISDELSLLYEKIRQLSHELAPVTHQIQNQCIIEAFGHLFSDMQRYRTISIDVQGLGDSSLKGLKKEYQAVLYSIVEELLINISKHARSQKVTVNFSEDKTSYCVVVRDYGIGLPKMNHRGMGLKNITANTQLLRGDFKMTNTQPGCSAKVCFPKYINRQR